MKKIILLACIAFTVNSQAQLLNKLNKAKNTANQASEVVETVQKVKSQNTSNLHQRERGYRLRLNQSFI